MSCRNIFGAALFLSAGALQAAPFAIDSLTVTGASVTQNWVGGTTLGLSVLPGVDLVAGYATVAITNLMGGDQTLYTAASNLNPNGLFAGGAGMIAGGPAPSGTVDGASGTIAVDMSSWFSNHFAMDQNLGGAASGTWNALTQDYTMSWTATLTQGMFMGNTVTWTLSGVAAPVPEPATFGLMAIGLAAVAMRARARKAPSAHVLS
jgi:hypothetical protein